VKGGSRLEKVVLVTTNTKGKEHSGMEEKGTQGLGIFTREKKRKRKKDRGLLWIEKPKLPYKENVS